MNMQNKLKPTIQNWSNICRSDIFIFGFVIIREIVYSKEGEICCRTLFETFNIGHLDQLISSNIIFMEGI